ncbi:MAG: hypothetical protein K9M44_04140 [Candidatus Pacebacteria bacterium]|nr:hypothetical protein [Candidatus Paceibacterota bacterium]MCF7900588.1 hypothetical protein [Candidatus Babeliales bacterium]
MFNFKPKFTDEKATIKESVDRKNRQPKGELPVDEDEELVNKNDPRKKFISPEDVADDYDFTDHIKLGDDNEEGEEDLADELELKADELIKPSEIVEEQLLEEMIEDRDKDILDSPGSEKIGLESDRDYGIDSKKYIRQNIQHGRGYYGDNLKTMPDSKIARDKRGVTREFLGK